MANELYLFRQFYYVDCNKEFYQPFGVFPKDSEKFKATIIVFLVE